MEWIPGNFHLGEMPSFSHLKRRIRQQIRWSSTDLLARLGFQGIPQGTGGHILVYHGIDHTGNTKINGRFLGKKTFEAQLKLFRKHFHIVSLQDFVSGQRHPGKTTVALTFDDGYQNNFDLALPLLEAYQIPATFFITTPSLRGEDILWPDLLDLLAFIGTGPLVLDEKRFVRNRKQQFIEKASGKPLKKILKNIPPNQFEKMLKDLHQAADFKAIEKWHPYWKLMDKETLQRLNQSPMVSIGAHGVSHQSLPNLTPEDWRTELTAPKAWLEEVLQTEVTDFAYPDGDYRPEMLPAVLESGYQCQLLADPKFEESDSELNALSAFPRMGINPYISQHNQLTSIVRGGYT